VKSSMVVGYFRNVTVSWENIITAMRTGFLG
jgi:hypothetical protein